MSDERRCASDIMKVNDKSIQHVSAGVNHVLCDVLQVDNTAGVNVGELPKHPTATHTQTCESLEHPTNHACDACLSANVHPHTHNDILDSEKFMNELPFLKDASPLFIKNNKFKSPTRPYELEFESKPPSINVANECPLIDKFQKTLVAELIRDKVLIPCDKTQLQCIANSFFVGEGASTRLITDFKCLNPYMKQKLPVHKCDCRSIAVKLSEPGFRANLMRRAFFSEQL
eukprot:GHVR01161935.1.p1 GENE.GHVR01161935.1~~GHVR01161935.1.p1  ORF type:complete len:230 (+),score=29.05 GHVR01161935.1:127-816(+)